MTEKNNENFSSPNNGIQKVAKDKTTLRPCHCPACGGLPRNRRTIRIHFSSNPHRHSMEDGPSSSLDTSNYIDFIDSDLETSSGVDETIHASASVIQCALPSGTLFAANHAFFDESPVVSDSDNGSNNDEVLEDGYGDDDIAKAVLRCLESKVKNGWSQTETLSELRNLYELTKDERIPHQSWEAVLKYLKKLGYKDPKTHKVCCGSNHITLLKNNEDCPNCGKTWKDASDYFVLGIRLQNCFLNENTTAEHCEHWKQKNEWFVENAEAKYKEIWHGKRFKELSYFWDENIETFLPVKCPHCETVISVTMMESAIPPGGSLNDHLHLSCVECMFDFVHKPKKIRGCPLNQAYIFHEDGFNAFEKKSRSVSTIHITSACISKEKRTSGKYLRVFSFIPSVLIGEGIPHKMDAFLQPLVDEVKDLYINGINITLTQEVNLGNGIIVQPGNYTVRMLLLCGTADLKGHQEILLYAGGGKCGCRRCLLKGTYIPAKKHYYFGQFGVRFRHPPNPKTAEYYLHHGKKVDDALTQTEKRTLQTETGVAGVSVLFELHALYGFDPVHDMVIDRMHLTFNMLKREFLDQMWVNMGDNANKTLNERVPQNGGLIVHSDFEKALNSVAWPKEERASGVARLKSLTDKLGSWKSNEFKKFSAVAREILAGIIPSKAVDSYIMLCEAVKMLYCKQLQTVGWCEENISRLRDLLWTHAIKAEEYYGLGFCTENLEYSVHVASDIMRHSSMDNYSCELYERAIRMHKKQKHNSKGLEKTFVQRESIRDFIHEYKQKHGEISTYDSTARYEFEFEALEQPDPILFKESSFTAATQLLKGCKGNENPKLQHAVTFGVALEKINLKRLSVTVARDVKRYFRRVVGFQDQDFSNIHVVKTVKSVAIKNQFGEVVQLSIKDNVIIESADYTEQWIICVKEIIITGPVQGSFYTFINGSYYIPVIQNGHVVTHQWTNTTMLVPRDYNRDSIQPLSSFKRKVMIYPGPNNVDPGFYLCINFKYPEIAKPVKVPIYPDIGDIVKVKGPGNQFWYGKVTSVNVGARKASVHWYTETKREGIFVPASTQDDIFFSSILGLAEMKNAFGGMAITDSLN